MDEQELASELSNVMNDHCIDTEFNTPDFVLGEYLVNALKAFGRGQQENDRWHGRGSFLETLQPNE